MWVVQALLVLPRLGQGYFGMAISQSAPIWSWALNASYGFTIGMLYARSGQREAGRGADNR
jgi:hypothetical protein